jgi:glycosyltransferase involved in cell wall biosynthesis
MLASRETISVIIPAFNRRAEIARAVASARAQTLPPHEIIVVDDSSSDETAAAAEALGVTVLRHGTNQGAASARNTGIAAASGDWIAFLDSDDEWEPGKLATQLAAHFAAPDAPASVTGYIIHDYRTGERRGFHPTPADATLDALVWGCPLGVGSTLLARREIFAEIGPLDPGLPRLEDWEWLMRYLPRHRLGVIGEALTIVHKGGDPSRAQVFAATARIRALHRDDWYRRSLAAGRKFDSTLLVEEAASAYYAGDLKTAAALSLRALVAWPFRGLGFFAELGRRALKAF